MNIDISADPDFCEPPENQVVLSTDLYPLNFDIYSVFFVHQVRLSCLCKPEEHFGSVKSILEAYRNTH